MPPISIESRLVLTVDQRTGSALCSQAAMFEGPVNQARRRVKASSLSSLAWQHEIPENPQHFLSAKRPYLKILFTAAIKKSFCRSSFFPASIPSLKWLHSVFTFFT